MHQVAGHPSNTAGEIRRCLLLLALLGGAVGTCFGQSSGGGTEKAPPPPPRARVSGGFAVELQTPDRFIGCIGRAPTLMLWRDHILAARQRLIVAGSDISLAYLEPLLQLRRQRPEVEVICLVERSSLGATEELAARLAGAGIGLYYRTTLAPTVGLQEGAPLAGLVLVRDATSVLMVSGTANQGDAIVFSNLIESEPVAKEFANRLLQLRDTLPKYPETQNLFNVGS